MVPREIHGMRHSTYAWLGAVIVVILGGQPALAQEETKLAPAVQRMQTILRDTANDPVQREAALRGCLPALQEIGDLRNVLALREWCDLGLNEKVAAVDHSARSLLAERFGKSVRAALEQEDVTFCLAVIELLAETGANVRSATGPHALASELGPDLAALTRRGSPEVRDAAARALGKIAPDPDVAVNALQTMMETSDRAGRLAAAEGLCQLLHTVHLLVTSPRDPNAVHALPPDLLGAACAVVPVAGRGLSQAQPEVRCWCTASMSEAAASLADLAPVGKTSETTTGERHAAHPSHLDLQPLVRALRDYSSALTTAMTDADPRVRAEARRAVSLLGDAQVHLRATKSALAQPDVVQRVGYTEPASSPVLTEEQRRPLQTLVAGLSARDARDRRTALEALEALGPAAATVIPDVTRSLADRDPFVRWAAARALSRLGATRDAVAALAKALSDRDVDVRRAVVATLESYGAYSAPAVPLLVNAMTLGDAEQRADMLSILGNVGPDQALAAVCKGLQDPDERVRQKAATVLGQWGPAALGSADLLRAALHDRDADVRRAASEALVHILQAKIN